MGVKHVWIGGTPAVAQDRKYTLPADIESGQTMKAMIGLKKITYPFPDGPLRADVAAAFVELWESSEIPEFAEITATDNGDGSFNLTAKDEGKPFFVTILIGDDTNEIQTVTILGSPTGGTFTLEFDGQVTGNIALDASAATVQSELEGLSNIDPGDVSVSGPDGGPWGIEFTGNLSDTDVALLIADDTLLNGTNEEQVITLASASGGTFTASYNGQATGPIAYNASAATFQSALEGLSTIGAGNVSVSGPDGGPWTVEFIGDLRGTDVSLITIDGANLTGKLAASIAETTPGGGGSNERHIIQAGLADNSNQNGRLSISGDNSVTGGTWDLTISNSLEDLVTLTDIPFDVTVAELQELIDAATVSWGSNLDYRIFIAHIFGSNPAGDDKFSDGGGGYWQVDSASGQTGLVVDVDSTNLTGGTYSGFVSQTLYFGDSYDYGDGAGSWKLLVDGNGTDDLSPTISGADLKTAIEGIAAIGAGNVAVYELGEGQGFKFGGGFVIEFIGDLSNQATGFTITTSKSVDSDLNLQVWTGYTGSSGTGEVQTLSISGGPGSGTFGLSYGGHDTDLLDYNSTAGEIEAALEGLPSIGAGNVSCSGGVLPGIDVVITFANALSGEDLDEIEVIFGISAETVTGGGLPSVDIKTTQTKVSYTTVAASQGPNDWNTAANWDTNTVPGDTDDVTIYDGDDILYGLATAALNRFETYRFETKIGLPRRNDNYFEYRDRALKINAAEIVIGLGDNGSGSDRINLEIVAGSNPLIEVHDSGSGEDGEPAVQITGENSANTAELLILDGEVGIGALPKQSGYFKKVTQRGGELRTGSDVSIAELISTHDGEYISDRTTIGGEATL